MSAHSSASVGQNAARISLQKCVARQPQSPMQSSFSAQPAEMQRFLNATWLPPLFLPAHRQISPSAQSLSDTHLLSDRQVH